MPSYRVGASVYAIQQRHGANRSRMTGGLLNTAGYGFQTEDQSVGTRAAPGRSDTTHLVFFELISTEPSGDGAITEAADTLAATAQVAVQAAGAATLAGDALAGAGQVEVRGDAAITLAGDTLLAAGAVEVRGVGAVTLAGDGLLSAGIIPVGAVGTVVEGPDQVAGVGSVGGGMFVVGSGAVAEGADTLAGTATVEDVPPVNMKVPMYRGGFPRGAEAMLEYVVDRLRPDLRVE